ncbi:RidA family protein [Piscirickettsia litoralis]|uniref:Reactive intermediate/imine deaminase n=1 Tax=Piscirickettsia litoralis TaxID=1891921 RepID=A0ABX3A5W1_9GAMM|nr:RidA family protein [Piscirickettsia litoralis]ODN43612.1 reactive intermediate/imine deaminase [Piscirickettsia litoralis]
MKRHVIQTDNAPAAIGTYSQAIQVKDTVYISGQIPLDPKTSEITDDDFEGQVHQVFRNLAAICKAAGGSIDDIVKLNLYLTDLDQFAKLNLVMQEHFKAPFPARAAVEVSALPKGVQVEADAVLVLENV